MARPRSFDERRVLELARDRFWATGYAGTRMDDIAEATGLGKGSLYGAFGDKSALFRKSLLRYAETYHPLYQRALSGPNPSPSGPGVAMPAARSSRTNALSPRRQSQAGPLALTMPSTSSCSPPSRTAI